jgi:hypothetical protein
MERVRIQLNYEKTKLIDISRIKKVNIDEIRKDITLLK